MNPFSNNRNAMMHQQSYSAEPYREGMDYTDEAWAYGLRALPGSLANQLQALGEYTTGKDYPNKLGNYLNELTQVNEMGYTPQTEYEAGVAFLPELVYDPAIIAGAPYTAYKAARNAPRLLNVLADEAGRTTMRNQLGMIQSGYEKGKIYDTAGNAYTPTGAHGWRLQGYPITREEADALEQQGFNTFREAYKGPETTGLEGWFARDNYSLPDNIKSREAWRFGKDDRMDNDLGFVSNDYFQAGEPLGNLGAFKSQLGAVDTPRGLVDNSGMDEDILYHGGFKDMPREILPLGMDKFSTGGYIDNRFGGLFAGPKDIAESHSSSVYKLKPRGRKATSADIESAGDEVFRGVLNDHTLGDITDDEYMELIDLISENTDINRSEPRMGIERLNEILNISPETGMEAAEASWKIQGLRGEIARRLGYGSVDMSDEHGLSRLVLDADFLD